MTHEHTHAQPAWEDRTDDDKWCIRCGAWYSEAAYRAHPDAPTTTSGGMCFHCNDMEALLDKAAPLVGRAYARYEED